MTAEIRRLITTPLACAPSLAVGGAMLGAPLLPALAAAESQEQTGQPGFGQHFA